MNILAFDTCFGAVSAAVRRQSLLGEWVQHETIEMHSGGNAERLFQVITATLAETGLELADIDRLAVTLGPGTFTGLRVGTAAARGLALAAGKPVVGTSSLAVIAEQARRLASQLQGVSVTVAMDARRGALYVQHFSGSAGGPETEPALLTPEEAADRMCAARGAGGDIHVVGSGAEPLADAIRARGRQARVQFTDIQAHAGALALMAPHLEPLASLMPIYLRQPDAKEPARQPQYLAQP
jgi:tRNA threonylcarbamoyladenosine biosynthesis protein TsaB